MPDLNLSVCVGVQVEVQFDCKIKNEPRKKRRRTLFSHASAIYIHYL